MFLAAFHIACREVSDPRWLLALQRQLYLILIFAFNSFLTMSGNFQLLSLELATGIHRSNGKITFQSFFMLMTVQPFFFASS
jgi:hypothetical protein